MKQEQRQRRRKRIRAHRLGGQARLIGTAERPRASVFRSLSAISVQLVDDARGHTLLALRSTGAETNIAAAKAVGQKVGEQALAMGVKQVVFDRNGYRYHGRVKAVAEGMRTAGLNV